MGIGAPAILLVVKTAIMMDDCISVINYRSLRLRDVDCKKFTNQGHTKLVREHCVSGYMLTRSELAQREENEFGFQSDEVL